MFQFTNRDGREFCKFGDGEAVKEIDVTEWADEDKLAFRAELESLQEESKATEAAAEEIKRNAESPAELIRQAREHRDLVKEVRDALERTAREDKLWRELQKQHGKGRVMRFDSKDGMICARIPTEKEALEHYLGCAGLALAERVDAMQEHILAMVVEPSEEAFKVIAAKWPLIWEDMENGIRGMQSARLGEQGPFV